MSTNLLFVILGSSRGLSFKKNLELARGNE